METCVRWFTERVVTILKWRITPSTWSWVKMEPSPMCKMPVESEFRRLGYSHIRLQFFVIDIKGSTIWDIWGTWCKKQEVWVKQECFSVFSAIITSLAMTCGLRRSQRRDDARPQRTVKPASSFKISCCSTSWISVGTKLKTNEGLTSLLTPLTGPQMTLTLQLKC